MQKVLGSMSKVISGPNDMRQNISNEKNYVAICIDYLQFKNDTTIEKNCDITWLYQCAGTQVFLFFIFILTIFFSIAFSSVNMHYE